jgi:dihydroorotase
MPNTQPAIDNEKEVKRLKEIIHHDAAANVLITGAITKGRNGEELTDVKRMKKEGIVAISDDGNGVQEESLMLRALGKAKEEGVLLISHCENKAISKNGVINEGIIATKLGLRGIPRRAEYEFVERDIRLAKKKKSGVHIAHVSCKESVDIIRKAKRGGTHVNAETAPHYFSLQDSCCETYDTRTKMNPPLRTAEDIAAIIDGLSDGTIDAIASDHAPHGKHEKEIEFELAAFGIVGLETSLGISILTLVHGKKISWNKLVELMSVNPAALLGLPSKGSLSVGSDADVTIIDPDQEWTFTKDSVVSKSKNSPFLDWKFKGRATDVIVSGTPVLRNGSIQQ